MAKARSAGTTSQAGINAENRQTRRPSAHNATSTASGVPATGGRLVQLGIAVSRKPPTAAITKPNSISWMCQVSGSKLLGNAASPENSGSHAAIDSTAHAAVARKNGRNPAVSSGGGGCIVQSSTLSP